MKTLQDKFVSDHLWYLVLAYMHATGYKCVDQYTKYDEKTGLPEFHLGWLTYEQFKKLAEDATRFFLALSEDITEENIDKYAEK